MNEATFNNLLERQYNGDVVPAERFTTVNGALLFHCKVCDTTFYNRPNLILGRQQHKCMFNYSDVVGLRTKNKSGKKSEKTKKPLSKEVTTKIDLLYGSGDSPKYIALQVKESVGSVLYYLNKNRKN